MTQIRGLAHYTTGSPSSKYEHRQASALLRNIQNIRICMGKKTYRFGNIGKWKLGFFYVNGFLSVPLKDSNADWDSNYSHSEWETVSWSRCFLSRVLMSTGARDCLPPRVWVFESQSVLLSFNGTERKPFTQQTFNLRPCRYLSTVTRSSAEVQSMASDGKGCRNLRPLIRSRCKGVLKQDNEWKGQLSCVT